MKGSEQHSPWLRSRKDVLVIIPAYNEEASIGEVVAGIRHNVNYADVLVIDDGSRDDTGIVARRQGASVLTLPHNLGIGGAVRAGLTLAEELGYPWVVRMDGDGQHGWEYIPQLLHPIQEGRADMAFGSRFSGGINTYQPSLARRLGIRLYGLAVSLAVGQRITDATSGLWCLNLRAIRLFAQYFPQDYPEVESHILLHKAGLTQIEIPVGMRPRLSGSSSIGPMRSVYYAFKVLLAAGIRTIQPLPNYREDNEHAVNSADRRSLG
jgi:glycosyltransferase involved in cell wall biosynthesis